MASPPAPAEVPAVATPIPFPVPVPPAPPSTGDDFLLVVAGLAGVALLFALREFAAGALRRAGEDSWSWLRRRRRPEEGR